MFTGNSYAIQPLCAFVPGPINKPVSAASAAYAMPFGANCVMGFLENKPASAATAAKVLFLSFFGVNRTVEFC